MHSGLTEEKVGLSASGGMCTSVFPVLYNRCGFYQKILMLTKRQEKHDHKVIPESLSGMTHKIYVLFSFLMADTIPEVEEGEVYLACGFRR